LLINWTEGNLSLIPGWNIASGDTFEQFISSL